MPKCIQCNKETPHSICPECADNLLNNMSQHDQLAHALVGKDALRGLHDLNSRLIEYKKLSTDELMKMLFGEKSQH